jgi:hypothetical protein
MFYMINHKSQAIPESRKIELYLGFVLEPELLV